MISLVIAALAVLISVVATMGGFGSAVGYAFGVGLGVLGGVFTRVAFIAHVRRMTCGLCLAAYEDALGR